LLLNSKLEFFFNSILKSLGAVWQREITLYFPVVIHRLLVNWP